MASPPHRSSAGSPPYSSATSLPGNRKRPLPSLTTNAPYPAKRTNTSFSATSSSHPLRQTSFPPEEAQFGPRSPSVDSIVTAGTGARSVTASATKPKKRGRKRKDDTQSVRSGTGLSVARDRDTVSRTSRGPVYDDQDAEEDDEVDDKAVDDLVESGEKANDALEKQRLAVLLLAFDAEQNERYDLHRGVKLKKETVRKIVNQTLSQSVPPSVITTISGFTKVFLAELIERARDVQDQQVLAIKKSLPSPEPSPPETPGEQGATYIRPSQTSLDVLPIETQSGYKGPLQPDHFREAYRRYRLNGEGGGAGVEGRSTGLGISGSSAIRRSGRRLFN